MKIVVLRLGHRHYRDHRISTHCGLVARAFGAGGIVFSGEHDEKLVQSVKKAVENWGGPFGVSYEKDWKAVIKRWDGIVVHLTFYGMPVQEKIREIQNAKNDVLIVIGSERVPRDVYELADYNVAVTSQPHSEVAALAVFLHEYLGGGELGKKFSGAKMKIVPQERGKAVERPS